MFLYYTSLWLLLLLLASKWWLIVGLRIVIDRVAIVGSGILIVRLNVGAKCGIDTLLVALIGKICTSALFENESNIQLARMCNI